MIIGVLCGLVAALCFGGFVLMICIGRIGNELDELREVVRILATAEDARTKREGKIFQ